MCTCAENKLQQRVQGNVQNYNCCKVMESETRAGNHKPKFNLDYTFLPLQLSTVSLFHEAVESSTHHPTPVPKS